MNAIGNLGSQVNSIAYALPQLRMQQERMRQIMALQEAQRILRMVQAKEAQQRGGLYEAQTGLTKQKTSDLQSQQGRADTINQGVQQMIDPGSQQQRNAIEGMTGIPNGTPTIPMAQLLGTIAAQEAMRNPAQIGQALANTQFFGQNQQDPLAMFALGTGRSVPSGQAAGTGIAAPFAPQKLGAQHWSSFAGLLQSILGNPRALRDPKTALLAETLRDAIQQEAGGRVRTNAAPAVGITPAQKAARANQIEAAHPDWSRQQIMDAVEQGM